MINRAAVILCYKEPFIRWINESDPNKDDPGVNAEELKNDKTVYLISRDDVENIDRWITRNFKVLFEDELESWYTDESLWPKKRDRKTFNAWFDVEWHSVITDTAKGPIENDEEE